MRQLTSRNMSGLDHIKSEVFIERNIFVGMRFQIDVLLCLVQIVEEGNKHALGNALELLFLTYDKIEKIPAVVTGVALFHLHAKALVTRLRI